MPSNIETRIEQADDPYIQYRMYRGQLWGKLLAGLIGTVAFWYVLGLVEMSLRYRVAAVAAATLAYYLYYFNFQYPEIRRKMNEKKAEAGASD